MSGRDEAFTEFVRAASRGLRRTAYLVCGDWHRADDALQEALQKLYVAWPKVDRTGNAYAYARRAVINATIDTSRRPWRRERSTEAMPDVAVADHAADHAERDAVLDVLRQVPPRQRACIVLRYYDGLSVEETASALGCAVTTVRSQTNRGLATMQELLTLQRTAAAYER